MVEKKKTESNGANVSYEAKLWKMADARCGSMDAPEYKHVAFGLIFFKHVSGASEELHARLQTDKKWKDDQRWVYGVPPAGNACPVERSTREPRT